MRAPTGFNQLLQCEILLWPPRRQGRIQPGFRSAIRRRRRRLCPGPAVSLRLADGVEVSDSFSRSGLESFSQCVSVVGDEFGGVPGAADFDVEAFLGGQARVVCLHDGDYAVDGSALEGVDGGRPCVVDMSELGVVAGEFERPAVFEPEGDAALLDACHFGGVVVDEAESGVVSGPPDSVSGSEFDVLGAIDLDGSAPSADAARAPYDGPAARRVEGYGCGAPVDFGDTAFVALFDAEALVPDYSPAPSG